MRLVWGSVESVLAEREGCVELCVTVDGREGAAYAYAYPALTGVPAPGERVLLNTTAVDFDLGTGGRHFVLARLASGVAPAGIAFEDAMELCTETKAGHIMKLRYSPLQFNVLSVEAQESPYHKIMEHCETLDGTPVVCCGLHSQVPLVAAFVKKAAPHLRVAYVMNDQASLALSLSDVLAEAVEVGLIDLTVSTGQSFGGQIEAINMHSGLLAAAHIGGCDVLITAIGPGLAGTGTPFGHGGVAQGEAVNATAALGGSPVFCLRMSQADKRQRHQGISHHSLVALSRVALAPATIALPALAVITDAALREKIEGQLDTLPNQAGHEAFQLDDPFFDEAALRGLKVTTMGRSSSEDVLFFEAAAAAGAVAAALAVREDAPATNPSASSILPPCVAKFDIMGDTQD